MNYKTNKLERAKATQLIGALGEMYSRYGRDITGLTQDGEYLRVTNELAEANIPLVGHVIECKFPKMQTSGMENLRDECLQEGQIALVEFTREYDPRTSGVIKPAYRFVNEATRAVSRHIERYLNSLHQDPTYFGAQGNSDGSIDNALAVNWQDPTFDAVSKAELATIVDQVLQTLPYKEGVILALSCGLWRDVEGISQESELYGMEMESRNDRQFKKRWPPWAITNAQICEILHISEPTLSKYRNSAFRRMRHYNRARRLKDFC